MSLSGFFDSAGAGADFNVETGQRVDKILFAAVIANGDKARPKFARLFGEQRDIGMSGQRFDLNFRLAMTAREINEVERVDADRSGRSQNSDASADAAHVAP